MEEKKLSSRRRGGGIGTPYRQVGELVYKKLPDVYLSLKLKETTTPTAYPDYGRVYTKNDNNLYFQDGGGSEHTVNMGTGGGDVSVSGIPVDSYVAVWTNGTDIEGIDDLQWDGTTFTIGGGAVVAGAISASSHLTLDDGVGNSPNIQFVGGTNDDVVSLYLSDQANPGESIFSIELAGLGEATRLYINNSLGNVEHQFGATGHVVHNEQGNDADFRVEGVGEANALFVQGSDGFVGAGTNAPVQRLHIYTTSGSAYARIETTDAAYAGLILNNDNAQGFALVQDTAYDDGFTLLLSEDPWTRLWYVTLDGKMGVGLIPTANMVGLSIEAGLLTLKERATPTADVNYGKIYTKNDNALYFQDGAGVEKSFLPLSGGILTNNLVLDDGAGDSPSVQFVGGTNDDTASIYLDDSAGAGWSDLTITLPGDSGYANLLINNASDVVQHNFGATGAAVFNEAGNDADFRVESDTDPYALFLQGSSGYIGMGRVPTANMAGLAIEDGLLTLKERATPTADATYGKFYCKDNNKMYFQDGAGVEHEMAFAPF